MKWGKKCETRYIFNDSDTTMYYFKETCRVANQFFLFILCFSAPISRSSTKGEKLSPTERSTGGTTPILNGTMNDGTPTPAHQVLATIGEATNITKGST